MVASEVVTEITSAAPQLRPWPGSSCPWELPPAANTAELHTPEAGEEATLEVCLSHMSGPQEQADQHIKLSNGTRSEPIQDSIVSRDSRLNEHPVLADGLQIRP